jgi:hypothetical protein
MGRQLVGPRAATSPVTSVVVGRIAADGLFADYGLRQPFAPREFAVCLLGSPGWTVS